MLAIEREQIPAPAVEGQPLEIVVGGNNQPPPVGVLFPNIGFGFGDPLALPQQPNIPTGAGFIALARLDIPDEGSFNPGGAGLPGPNVDLADIAPLEDQSQGTASFALGAGFAFDSITVPGFTVVLETSPGVKVTLPDGTIASYPPTVDPLWGINKTTSTDWSDAVIDPDCICPDYPVPGFDALLAPLPDFQALLDSLSPDPAESPDPTSDAAIFNSFLASVGEAVENVTNPVEQVEDGPRPLVSDQRLDEHPFGEDPFASALRTAQSPGDISWLASRPGSVTIFAWDGLAGSQVVPVLAILGPGNFGDRFGVYTATDVRPGRGSSVLDLPVDPAACTDRCLWVTAPAGAPGDPSSVFIIDLARAPNDPILLADPALPWVLEISGIPNGQLGLAIDMADLNGDGYPEILIGVPGGSLTDLDENPPPSDGSGVAYALIGPLTGDSPDHIARRFGGGFPGQGFAGDIDIADLDLDGFADFSFTSANVQTDPAGPPISGLTIFFGGPLRIDDVTVESGVTTITGSGLDAGVLIDGQPALVTAGGPNTMTVAGAGLLIEIRGLFGTATFQLEAPQRIVPLGSGFNLVGWTGATPIEEALATVDGSFTSVFVWDPLAEVFRSFNPDAPSFINDLEELLLGDGLWINIDDPGGATWTQPDFIGARSLNLVPGLQLAVWTGPDGVAIEEALAGLPAAVIQILAWDAASERFDTFNPLLPAGLNTLRTLNHGDAFWIEVAQGVTWDQPAAGNG